MPAIAYHAAARAARPIVQPHTPHPSPCNRWRHAYYRTALAAAATRSAYTAGGSTAWPAAVLLCMAQGNRAAALAVLLAW
jgi:hypothetical protein